MKLLYRALPRLGPLSASYTCFPFIHMCCLHVAIWITIQVPSAVVPDWIHRKHLGWLKLHHKETQGFIPQPRALWRANPAACPASLLGAEYSAHPRAGLEATQETGASGRAWSPGAGKIRLSRYRSVQSRRSLRPTMIQGKKLNCLWTLGLCLVASKSPPKVPSITNQTFIDESVKAHNEARGRVQPTAANMKHMVRKNPYFSGSS